MGDQQRSEPSRSADNSASRTIISSATVTNDYQINSTTKTSRELSCRSHKFIAPNPTHARLYAGELNTKTKKNNRFVYTQVDIHVMQYAILQFLAS